MCVFVRACVRVSVCARLLVNRVEIWHTVGRSHWERVRICRWHGTACSTWEDDGTSSGTWHGEGKISSAFQGDGATCVIWFFWNIIQLWFNIWQTTWEWHNFGTW